MILIYLVFVPNVIATASEISCSVFLYGENDWLIANNTNNCVQQVLRVREFCGGKKVNFVPTLFFEDLDDDNIPEYYTTKQGLEYYQVNETNTLNYEQGMIMCFQSAIENGYNVIEITPHLDDGSGQGKWRNIISMNPLKKYSNKTSYYRAMIHPLLHSVNVAVRKTRTTTSTQVNFSLQGEMNRMLMDYPLKWLKMANVVRCLLPNDKSKVGVSVNFNRLCGNRDCSPYLKELKILDIQQMFKGMDFVGMSSYPSMSEIDNVLNFANGVRTLAKEFLIVGVDISKFPTQGISLHFSEFGIGGASCDGNNFVATTPEKAMLCPWFGVHGPFQRETNPWQSAAMKKFQTYYYQQLSRWVEDGTDKTFPIDAIYIWNVASWDVAGIYKDSSSVNGTYRNEAVVEILKNLSECRLD